MTVTVSQLDPDDPRWPAFVAMHPNACIFHHPAWVGMMARCYGFPQLILAAEENGTIVGLLPALEARGWLRGRRIISLPFTDHCTPLGDAGVVAELVKALDAARRERGCSGAEVRAELPLAAGIYGGARVALHETVLDGDTDRLLERMHRTRVRQPIEAARRANVRLTRGDAWEDLEAFMRLHVDSRRRHGVPVQPFRFFRLLHECVFARGHGFVTLAYLDDRPVAGGVFLVFNGRVVYKFGAADPAARHAGANHLLLWDTLVWSSRDGNRIFDWGLTELRHESLLEFKRGWGTSERVVRWTHLADTPPAQEPSDTLERIAAGVIRHSPRWVARTLGELFYGQFA